MRKSYQRILRHLGIVVLLGFFVAIFFIGRAVDPAYIEIARSPYGLFTYFIATALTAFIPSLTTLPLVITATIIWGPWLAGAVAVLGWTIGGVIEYAAAYFSIDALIRWFDATKLNERIERVRRAIGFWPVVLVRVFIPSFVFGVVKTRFDYFIAASVIAYIPLALAGVAGGELFKPYLTEIQPLIAGAALVLLIFSIDYLFIEHGKHRS